MEQTKNYHLKKPAPEDFYDVADQNGNMDTLDAALNAQAEALEQKADLGADGKVPTSQLPAFSALSLGETPTTAYRGDRGKIAYEHSMDGGKHVTEAEKQKLSAVGGMAADILELQGGKADRSELEASLAGKADLVSGKVPLGQLPPMNYDPAGSSDVVQENLNAHESDNGKHWSMRDRSEMETMREAVFANVTSNPFSITFSDLVGINLEKGNWNEAMARLEW